jgi:hypothetical protein
MTGATFSSQCFASADHGIGGNIFWKHSLKEKESAVGPVYGVIDATILK